MSAKTASQLLDELIAELQVCCADLPTPAPPAAPAATEAEGKEEKKAKVEKKAKAEKVDKPAVAPTAPAAELDVNALDLRVGVIVSVEKHATAEKLYCEMIDVGEEAPRAIASGLVPYYTLEQMQGRKLIAVCNLKPRNLVGFKSHGMVLCASYHNGDENRVEFVEPPADSKAGDRIVGAGLAVAEPLSASKCDKSKAWELLAADLQVNDQGEACWKTFHLTTLNGQICTAPTLRGVPIR